MLAGVRLFVNLAQASCHAAARRHVVPPTPALPSHFAAVCVVSTAINNAFRRTALVAAHRGRPSTSTSTITLSTLASLWWWTSRLDRATSTPTFGKTPGPTHA